MYDPKLIEAIKQAILDNEPDLDACARAALAAIEASETHCILPVAARDLLDREAHFAQFYDKHQGEMSDVR